MDKPHVLKLIEALRDSLKDHPQALLHINYLSAWLADRSADSDPKPPEPPPFPPDTE